MREKGIEEVKRMAMIECKVTSCKYHRGYPYNDCSKNQYVVSIDEVMTASGFYPICSNYVEKEEADND